MTQERQNEERPNLLNPTDLFIKALSDARKKLADVEKTLYGQEA